MFYFVKMPGWVQRLYPTRIWRVEGVEKKIFLTFDDGPHPVHTPYVLDLLKQYNARATFFCLGTNVAAHPEIYRRILAEGHAVGNHTFHHLNGKKTNDRVYTNDIAVAAEVIDSSLFRPPYGRMTGFQAKLLRGMTKPFKIIMWTVLSGDFDRTISPHRCLENVLLNAAAGDIVVFHDSDKAAANMHYALPVVLETFTKRGFTFEKIV